MYAKRIHVRLLQYEEQHGGISEWFGWHLPSHSMLRSTTASTYLWKFLRALGWPLVWPKKTRRQHFYHHYMTSQLSPDLRLLVCASWMISGLSTSVQMGVLIMGGETATKLNHFSTEGRANLQSVPANVWHRAHLQWANSPGRWKEQGEKFYYLYIFCETFCRSKNVLFCYICSRRKKSTMR